MSANTFFITYHIDNTDHLVEIRPCCKEDIVDYEVWEDDRLCFTVTKKNINGFGWVVGMKNAAADIPQKLVALIGEKIDRRSK